MAAQCGAFQIEDTSSHFGNNMHFGEGIGFYLTFSVDLEGGKG